MTHWCTVTPSPGLRLRPKISHMPDSESGSKPVSLDPDEVRTAAKHIGHHGSELGATHEAARTQAEQAAAGWVGSSGEALGALTEHWQTTTQKHTDRIDTFSHRMHTAASEFENVDHRSEEELRALDEASARAPRARPHLLPSPRPYSHRPAPGGSASSGAENSALQRPRLA
jgi:WXG100 family type VII secretion target